MIKKQRQNATKRRAKKTIAPSQNRLARALQKLILFVFWSPLYRIFYLFAMLIYVNAMILFKWHFIWHLNAMRCDGGRKAVANKWPYCLYALQMRDTGKRLHFKLATKTWIWLIQQLFHLIVCQCHITIIVWRRWRQRSVASHRIAHHTIHLMWVNPFFAHCKINEIYCVASVSAKCVMQNPHPVIK